MPGKQADHRTVTSFSIDRELLKLLETDIEERKGRGEVVSRSDIIAEALISYLGLERHSTVQEVPGPPVYKKTLAKKIRYKATKKRRTSPSHDSD